MAHFAEIDNAGVVLRVLVVPDAHEARGSAFLAEDLGLGGVWVQCSYNARIRKQYPSVGYYYDEVKDVFVAPQPYPSWSLNEDRDWCPPAPRPTGDVVWDEENLQWVEFAPPGY